MESQVPGSDDISSDPTVANPPPVVDEVQRVDAEPMEDARNRSAHGAPGQGAAGSGPRIHVFTAQSNTALALLKPPILATWICLVIAWLFLGSKVPFTVFLGIPFDLAALLLATVCLSRGGVFTGIFVLLLGTVGSLVVYMIGLFRFLALG